MQCTSYLPGYHYSRDQIVDASGGFWLQFNNSVFCRSGRDYNSLFQPPSIDQYLAYNKEGLRQMILKHEAVFKYQVHELHRLYGRQRELMDEIKLMQLNEDHLQVQTSLSNSFVTGMQFDTSKKALLVPSWILLNPRDDNPSAQEAENFQRPSSFASRKSMQSGSDVCLVENHLKEREASYGKRTSDLELLEYIDSDEGERLEKEKSPEVPFVLYDPSIKIVDSLPKSNLMLKKGVSSYFISNSRKTSCSFDLNEPLQIDESVNTNSSSLVYSGTCIKEIMHQDLDLSGEPRLRTPDLNEITHDILEGKGSLESSSISGLQIQSGKSPLSCNGKTTLSSKSAQTDQDFFDTNRQRMLTPCMTTSSQLVRLSDQSNAGASSSVSSQRASIKDVPTAIQALPCFNTPQFSCQTSRSSAGSSGNKGKYVCSNTNRACSPSLGRITSHMSCNGDSQLTTEHYSVTKCVKDSDHKNIMVDMDLNVMPSSSLPETEDSQEKDRSMDNENGFENYVGPLNGPGVMDCEGKQVVCPQLLEPPISRLKITLNSDSTVNKDIKIGEKVDVPAMANDSDKLEKCPKDDTCLATESGKDDTCLSTESGKEISKSPTCIDLCFSVREQKHSQMATITTAVGTDLQAPVSPDNKEHSPPREVSEDCQSEKLEDSVNDLEMIAAEAIVSIKLSGEQQCPNTSINGPLQASFDCLNLFAGIVCSMACDVENEFEGFLTAPGNNCSEPASNVLVHSEAMIFMPKGTKVEDHCYVAIDQKNKLTGDIVVPCQGQPRKARERKDFRSQVVLCASSLSSYDVTENLQSIKEQRVAARTASEPVKVGKKVKRVSRAKGRRHSKTFSLNIVGRSACSVSKQNTYQSEQSFLQSCSFGWGKKLRRQKNRRARTIVDFGLS